MLMLSSLVETVYTTLSIMSPVISSKHLDYDSSVSLMDSQIVRFRDVAGKFRQLLFALGKM